MLVQVLLVLVVVIVLVVIGWVFADHLMPSASAAPSHALATAVEATELDRLVAPLLAEHHGQSAVTLLDDGLDAFAARVHATRSAGRSLDLQYYMWRNDLCGQLLALEVVRAAERGVRVRVLLDDLNAKGRDPQMLALDAHPNIEIRLYNPLTNRRGLWRLLELLVRAWRINHRMHNKAWIADGRVAVVGGRNIGEAYFSAAADTNFRDLDMALLGPAVADAEAIFDDYWNSQAVVALRKLARATPESRLRKLVSALEQQSAGAAGGAYLARVESAAGVQALLTQQLQLIWSAKVAVVADPPQKWRADDRRQWLVWRLAQVLDSARTRASLVSPYFVPGEEGAQQLLALAQQGVKIGVVSNSLAANDVPAVHAGYARYRTPLLNGGVQLHELRAMVKQDTAGLFGSSGASLHTKAFVVDQQRGFVGSFNLDARSAKLNTEMGVLFDDAAIGAALEVEYRRLACPALSYAVLQAPSGALRWRDDAVQPPAMLRSEPDASLARRAVAKVLGWLPIESQL